MSMYTIEVYGISESYAMASLYRGLAFGFGGGQMLIPED